MARKLIGDKPLTNTEKSVRYKAKMAIKLKIAKERGFIPATLLLNKIHLLALQEAYGFKLDSDTISIFVFKALKEYLEKSDNLVTTKSKVWPKDHSAISDLEMEAVVRMSQLQPTQQDN